MEADLKFYAKLIQSKSDKVLCGIILAYLLTQLDMLCMEQFSIDFLPVPIDGWFRAQYVQGRLSW